MAEFTYQQAFKIANELWGLLLTNCWFVTNCKTCKLRDICNMLEKTTVKYAILKEEE